MKLDIVTLKMTPPTLSKRALAMMIRKENILKVLVAEAIIGLGALIAGISLPNVLFSSSALGELLSIMSCSVIVLAALAAQVATSLSCTVYRERSAQFVARIDGQLMGVHNLPLRNLKALDFIFDETFVPWSGQPLTNLLKGDIKNQELCDFFNMVFQEKNPNIDILRHYVKDEESLGSLNQWVSHAKFATKNNLPEYTQYFNRLEVDVDQRVVQLGIISLALQQIFSDKKENSSFSGIDEAELSGVYAEYIKDLESDLKKTGTVPLEVDKMLQMARIFVNGERKSDADSSVTAIAISEVSSDNSKAPAAVVVASSVQISASAEGVAVQVSEIASASFISRGGAPLQEDHTKEKVD